MGSGSPYTIYGASQSMGGNMSRRYGLTCSTGSSNRIIFFYFTGGSMSIE